MSTETLVTQVTGNIYATLQRVTPTDTITDTVVQPLSMSLANGNGDGVANQLFSGQFTVNGTNSTVFDLTFNGTNDAVGAALSLSTVKVFFIQIMNGTYGNYLNVTGSGAGVNGWTTAFSGTHTLYGEAGYMLLTGPTDLGFPVGAGNQLLKIFNPNLFPVQFNMTVVGSAGF